MNPQIAAAVDLTLQGELINAAIDPELHPDLRSANAWILDLGGQSPGFCRFSLHVLLVGFIRFLLDWIWLNWIDWVFWDMRERKQDLNLSELWQLEMISIRIRDALMWLIGELLEMTIWNAISALVRRSMKQAPDTWNTSIAFKQLWCQAEISGGIALSLTNFCVKCDKNDKISR